MKNNFVAPTPIETTKPAQVDLVDDVEETSTEIHLPDIEPGRAAFIVAMIAGAVAWKGGYPLLSSDWLFICAAFWVMGFVGALVYVAISTAPQRSSQPRQALRSEVKKRR